MQLRYFSLSCGVEYVEVPKCASTSIKVALARSDGANCEEYPHACGRWRRCPGDFIPCAVFTFVRHPLSRLRSAWREKLKSGKAKRLGGSCPLPVTASFAEWVAWVVGQPAASLDKHWKPQSLLLSRHRIDIVCKLERLAEDWGRLREEFGLPPLPALNRSGHQEEPLDWMTRDMIARFYAADLRHYDYEL